MREKKERTGTVSWRSPSNIALIKYWGKHGDQFPCNPSISLTLEQSFTETTIAYRPRQDFRDSISFTFRFQNTVRPDFDERIRKYLLKVRTYFPSLDHFHLDITSDNSFPHSAGIASSASAFSALALALQDMENEINGYAPALPMSRISEICRLGSGSACRSLFPVAALWGKASQLEASSDSYAIPMGPSLHETFRSYHDSILIVSRESKKVSSSAGHSLMNNHPFAPVRYEEARKNLQLLLDALKLGDLERMGFLVEMEAMQLHALMLCSNPNFVLMQPNTLIIMDLIKSFRRDTGIPVYFTLDAGPNVHVLYPDQNRDEVQEFIRGVLLNYCDRQQWIQDQVGQGPVKIR